MQWPWYCYLRMTMRLPRVSVIIPNYNHEIYLHKRIDSVLNQTYKDFEVIILDDCSTDNSRLIIKKYEGNPLITKIIYNDINSGSPFKQWQRGVELSRGEWVWIAESDDYSNLDFLEKMLNSLKKELNVGIIYCDSIAVDNLDKSGETFSSIKNKKLKTNRWATNHINNGKQEILNYVLSHGTINNTSAVLFNRKILLESNPFDNYFKYMGDKYTFIKVLANSHIIYVNEALNYYRDPFNFKHVDKYLYYFYEQFLIYDWAYKNLPIKNRRLFFCGFYQNTRYSVYRNWTFEKIHLYKNLITLNTLLFCKYFIHNLISPFKEKLKHYQ